MAITLEDIRQARIEACYELIKEKIQENQNSLELVMTILEGSQTEAELANDSRYCALCGLYENLKEVNEIINPLAAEDIVSQKSATSQLLNHQNYKKSFQQAESQPEKSAVVCDTDQVSPECKPHSLKPAIEIGGGLRFQSQEKLAEYMCSMKKDCSSQNPIENI